MEAGGSSKAHGGVVADSISISATWAAVGMVSRGRNGGGEDVMVMSYVRRTMPESFLSWIAA
jgi:hypothetical protein